MMSLAELKDNTTVITGEEAHKIREKYIARFIDTSSEYFHKYIATQKQFKDGLYYTGYLWDCFKHSERLTKSQLQSEVPPQQEVYVFWDLHSAEKIWIKDYWKFPKEAVLKLPYQELLAGRELLPEDLYILMKQ